MFGSLPQPAHMPCPDCGASVPRAEHGEHVCEPDQRERFQLFQVRLELEQFDGELTSWLATPSGRFAVFYAARQRRAA